MLEKFKPSKHFATDLDEKDPLSSFRNQFYIPKNNKGEELIYLCGNSLGLQPKSVAAHLDRELIDWANLGVEGHTKASNPWLSYHELLTGQMAKIVGAKPLEVVMMNTLTVNLHLMMVSFYKPTKERYKILIESDTFPSDRFAVASQLRHHGFNADEGIVYWKPKKGKNLLDYDGLEDIFKAKGDEIALVLLGGVNYYTGQYYNLKKITELAHNHGCKIGFDCAHGAGNVALDLHDSGADFAVWCSYKYLNSGPGSIAGCFVHERHAHNEQLNRFAGWWGHNKQTRFKMRDDFDQLPGAEGWQLSNPPILSMAAIKASLAIFEAAGMENLIAKSKKLTAYFEYLIEELNHEYIHIITPSNIDDRGCQLSVQVRNSDKRLFKKLTESGVIADWREPDVIRCAPVPLYNSFTDVYRMVEKLKMCLNEL